MTRLALTMAAAVVTLVALPACRKSPPDPPAQPLPVVSAAETIESSGTILGVGIGSPMNEAREKLDPLRAVGPAYQPDRKEELGRRIYWKLKETDYDWVMVWASAEGKITRVRAVFRREKPRPFDAIGDVKRAASADANSVKWNLRRPDGPNYRLVAQGTNQQANTVYMFATE